MNQLFCKNLKESRKANGFTQKKIAGYLNMAESSYANWELGRTEPSITDLQNLCVILDTSANELLGIEEVSNIKIANSFNGHNFNGNIQIGGKGNKINK